MNNIVSILFFVPKHRKGGIQILWYSLYKRKTIQRMHILVQKGEKIMNKKNTTTKLINTMLHLHNFDYVKDQILYKLVSKDAEELEGLSLIHI